ncbi:hypothetical protein [Finegoldia magna]|uniref:Uncharacterized protein n=1 Tax=Finegoldia magna (strain ATCC 29328 / DSM 20472 / WAL 2508) TaxID=334413 RepID=B0S493_FINM2|nr:hypothetical protein [Finegoldia magna]UEA71237.1 hypothetical protein LK415_08975 [Finegoldia magna]BAG09084.1 hypothetical protein FMG_P0035 [Finegoldia magna ATCC 29328]
MLTIKDLLDKGIIIQERATNVTLFSDIENLEDLEVENLISNDYYPELVETVWDMADYDLWLEYERYGVAVSFDDFEYFMNNWEDVEEVIYFIRRR